MAGISHEDTCCAGCQEEGLRDGKMLGLEELERVVDTAYEDGWNAAESHVDEAIESAEELLTDQIISVLGRRTCPRCNYPTGSRPASCLVCKVLKELPD